MEEAKLSGLLEKIFWQYAERQVSRIKNENRSFVHYTSTEAALSIIHNREIWLRNSGVMNDYSEMAHGEACLRFCLYENSDVASYCKEVLNKVQGGLHDRAVKWFIETAHMRRSYTYLLSISEHGSQTLSKGVVDEESDYGRLSMWRAYGNSGGVGLIFNHDALTNPTDVLNVYSSPVFYGNPDAFAHEFSKMLSFIEQNVEQVKQIAPETFWVNLTTFMHFSSLSCKHPGFAEEREWRITYSADPANEHVDDKVFNASSKIKREFRTINSIPQRIYKIPFVDYPDQGVSGITLPDILERLVIGPTQYPLVVHDAMYIALRRAGFDPKAIQIAVSQIPLRT
tara:strand:+ start:120 stop:1142 length:1023 start_codon:yes stop_codon:yes gene_type:complete